MYKMYTQIYKRNNPPGLNKRIQLVPAYLLFLSKVDTGRQYSKAYRRREYYANDLIRMHSLERVVNNPDCDKKLSFNVTTTIEMT